METMSYRGHRGRELVGVHYRHDVLLAHDDEFLAVHFDLSARVFAEENLVSRFNVRRAQLAVFQDLALTDGDDLAEGGLLGRGVRDHDAAGGFTLFGFALDDESVVQRSNFHGTSFWLVAFYVEPETRKLCMGVDLRRSE